MDLRLERFNAIQDLEGNARTHPDGTREVEVYGEIEGNPFFLLTSKRPDGLVEVLRNYTGKSREMGRCEKVTNQEVIEACKAIFTDLTNEEEMVDELIDILMFYNL
jgi:hypothetical protein